MTWLVVGATSAIARAFARQLAAQGEAVWLAGRDRAELETLAADLRLRGARLAEAVDFDARDERSRTALLERTTTLSEPLSVFYAVGVMADQARLLADGHLTAEMVSANYTGALLLLNALLPRFEAQRAGHIVLIGSVAGDRGRRKNFLYGSTKAGLAAYAEGLAAHLAGFGVPVLLVKPGVMDTALTWGLKNPPLPLGAPEGLARAVLARCATGGTLYYPWFWRYIMVIIRHLPRRIFNRLGF